MLEGGCSCGRVRYRLTGSPITVNCCHCRQCQRLSGSAFALNAMIEERFIEVLGATEPEVVSDEGGGRQWRCPGCNLLLFADHPMMNEDIRILRVGTLDEGEQLAPDAHYFVRSKHPWIALPPDVPAYHALPDDDGPRLSREAVERMTRALRG